MDHTVESTIARIQERAAEKSPDRAAGVLVDLMPKGGISLATATDYARAKLITSLVSALVAYCDQWDNPTETEPLDDVAVYAAMLNSLDGIQRHRDRVMTAAFTQPGPSAAVDQWAEMQADQIFPNTDEFKWWREGVSGNPEALPDTPSSLGGPIPYYSNVIGAYWGKFEQAAEFYRRRFEAFPDPSAPVETEQQEGTGARRRNYTPST